MRTCLYCWGLCVKAYAVPRCLVGTRNSLAPSGVDLNSVGVSTSVKPLSRRPWFNTPFSHDRNLSRAWSSAWKRIWRWRFVWGKTVSGVTMTSFGKSLRTLMSRVLIVGFALASWVLELGVAKSALTMTGECAGTWRNFSWASASISALEHSCITSPDGRVKSAKDSCLPTLRRFPINPTYCPFLRFSSGRSTPSRTTIH